MDGFTTPTARPVTLGRTLKVILAARTWFQTLLATTASGISRAAINRRVVRQLTAMSDRELRDIGLSRQDVWDAECLLPEGDASSFLVGRRSERRAGGRRVPRGQWPRPPQRD